MEKELIGGAIGEKAKYNVEFKGGSLVAKFDYLENFVKGGIHIEFPADVILDAIAKAIPGQIDDAIIELIKKSLKA